MQRTAVDSVTGFGSYNTAPDEEWGELLEAADHAASFDEFQNAFLAAEAKRQLFGKLCSCWASDDLTAYDRFQRIEVRSIGKIELEHFRDASKTLRESAM